LLVCRHLADAHFACLVLSRKTAYARVLRQHSVVSFGHATLLSFSEYAAYACFAARTVYAEKEQSNDSSVTDVWE
jgi:hypothetical protein